MPHALSSSSGCLKASHSLQLLSALDEKARASVLFIQDSPSRQNDDWEATCPGGIIRGLREEYGTIPGTIPQ